MPLPPDSHFEILTINTNHCFFQDNTSIVFGCRPRGKEPESGKLKLLIK